MGVRVDRRTPRSLWPPRQSQIRQDARGLKSLVGSRVPVVRPVRVTFESNVKRFIVRVWPASRLVYRLLQRLQIGRDFNQQITGIALPQSLRELVFGDQFNRFITDRPLCSSWCSGGNSISPSPELRGPRPCICCLSGSISVSTSLKWYGRPPCDRYRSGMLSADP